MKLKDYKKEALKDPKFKKEYERFDLLFELQQLWIKIKMRIRQLFNQP